GGERLRVRGDAKAVARCQLLASSQVGAPERRFQDDPALVRHGNHTARVLEQAHLELDPARNVGERGRDPAQHRPVAPPQGRAGMVGTRSCASVSMNPVHCAIASGLKKTGKWPSSSKRTRPPVARPRFPVTGGESTGSPARAKASWKS